jgi:hypothetical protein
MYLKSLVFHAFGHAFSLFVSGMMHFSRTGRVCFIFLEEQIPRCARIDIAVDAN